MFRLLGFVPLLLFCSIAHAARGPEIIDPEEAKKDPDFTIQGEYLGDGVWPGGESAKIGAQVIARGEGQFDVVVFRGGLPGDGWQRGHEQFALKAKREKHGTTLTRDGKPAGRIEKGRMTILNGEGKETVRLKRTERVSSTLGAKPPKDAVVLFDGTNLDNFPGAAMTEMKTLEAGCNMAPKRTMSRLHLEFRLSWKPSARGQGRSNSGVYIGGLPEIQVLDSFGLKGEKNECGAFYGRRVPDVNMCFAPLVWQTFDVEFTEPKRDKDGKPLKNILATVRHNGVVIHENYDTRKKEFGPRTLHLQRHGNRVQYRNIWIVNGTEPPPITMIDCHVHLRGGMTVEKAIKRQAATGIKIGVLKNIGKGWPIETDEQLRKFLDEVKGKPLYVGLQVNDRDWHTKHAPELLKRLDSVLGDTMIMPMPDDDSEPVKLWKADTYKIDDPEAWMKRYMKHNLRVLAEPITILANPTYLPPAVAKKYDQLWTDQRMRRIIQAAIDNNVALEINASSKLPSDRFIALAKKMGAKFSFGTNNFDDRPIDMARCFEAIDRHGLTKDDLYVPAPKD